MFIKISKKKKKINDLKTSKNPLSFIYTIQLFTANNKCIPNTHVYT